MNSGGLQETQGAWWVRRAAAAVLAKKRLNSNHKEKGRKGCGVAVPCLPLTITR